MQMKVCKKCKVKFNHGNCPKCRSNYNVTSSSNLSSYEVSSYNFISETTSDYGGSLFDGGSSYDSGSSSDSGGSCSSD